MLEIIIFRNLTHQVAATARTILSHLRQVHNPMSERYHPFQFKVSVHFICAIRTYIILFDVQCVTHYTWSCHNLLSAALKSCRL